MTDQSASFCIHCGAKLTAGANFCENCGRPVLHAGSPPTPAQPPAPPVLAATSAEPPTPEPFSPEPLPPIPPAGAYIPPAPKRDKTLPIVLGVLGCLGVLCIGLMIVGAVLFFRNASPAETPAAPVIATPAQLPTQLSQPTQAAQPTLAPQPTQAALPTGAAAPTQAAQPTLPPAQPAVWPDDIQQSLIDTFFMENFSNNQNDWAQVQDEIRFWGFEDNHYAMHLYQPDYSVWAYLPLDFTPTTISFDAALQPGYEQGGYGVVCHYRDEDNFHFVSIDVLNKEYSIGYVKDGDYISLMQEMWMPTKNLKESPYEVNHLVVVCDPGIITMFLNDKYEAEVSTVDDVMGDTAIFGETWEDTPAAGYRVWIDNLIAYVPKQ